MARATEARLAALQVLGEQRRTQGNARELLRSSDAVSALSESDRGQATRIVLGVVAARGILDGVIDGHLRHPKRLQPRVRDALRMSTFELCYLDARPDVAVSQGVELARSINPHVAGLANAVLRRVSQEDAPSIVAARAAVRDGAGDIHDLSLAGGLPEWLVEQVAADRGPDAARDLAACALEAAPVWVAANRALHAPEEARSLLAAQGLEPEADVLPDSFKLGKPAGLAASGLVHDCDVIVCDLGAQAVARIVCPGPGERVLEVGQGRGTKSLLMENCAIEQGGPCGISAAESDAERAEVAEVRMRRAGLQDAVAPRVLDARDLAKADDELPQALRKPFDTVFIDAPCSGTGTLRRHPEIAWRASAEDVASLAVLQGEILAAASTKVAPGGRLVYSTCSVLAEENEDVIQAFLGSDAGKGFHRQDVRTSLERGAGAAGEGHSAAAAADAFGRFVQEDGSLQTLPASGGCDGHYCASLVREG